MAFVEINEVCCRRTIKILKHYRLVDHIDVGAFIRLARFRSGKIQMVAKFREEKSVVRSLRGRRSFPTCDELFGISLHQDRPVSIWFANSAKLQPIASCHAAIISIFPFHEESNTWYHFM